MGEGADMVKEKMFSTPDSLSLGSMQLYLNQSSAALL